MFESCRNEFWSSQGSQNIDSVYDNHFTHVLVMDEGETYNDFTKSAVSADKKKLKSIFDGDTFAVGA